ASGRFPVIALPENVLMVAMEITQDYRAIQHHCVNSTSVATKMTTITVHCHIGHILITLGRR
ncbi:hypothetical protein L5849_15735, partial [Erythrobacter sp. SN021]|uniref:hypothetical protein n=1 Tax=Erythrobacter sp. SN021 TaxID=2912574 RepID=UPI001F287A38